MISEKIVFRPIEERDNEKIADLIRGVFREFGIIRQGTVYFDPSTDNMYSLFSTPGSAYWIAEENGVIIGGCGVYPTKSLPEGCAELARLYLSAASRGKGIGYDLMNLTFHTSKELGYRQLYLESLPEFSKAIGLYERIGFRFIPSPLGDSGHFGCHIWMLKNL